MPRADRFASSLFPATANKTAVRARVFTPVESASLGQALSEDAGDLYFSAWITFIDGLTGIQNQFFSWATVKMYYCLFYALRGFLSSRGFCTFHVGDSYYSVSNQPGASPTSSQDRGDHKAVANTFVRVVPSHRLLSQAIDLQPPLTWFTKLREQANYQRQRFLEPNFIDEFRQLERVGLRRLLNTYSADQTDTYTFDRDHAVLAFPLKALRLIGDDMRGAGLISATTDERQFLRAKARDAAGSLPVLQAEMRAVGLIP
jgi:hypothetical protein